VYHEVGLNLAGEEFLSIIVQPDGIVKSLQNTMKRIKLAMKLEN